VGEFDMAERWSGSTISNRPLPTTIDDRRTVVAGSKA